MWDVCIIGGGPAGVTSALYAARADLATGLIYMGGGALKKALVENYYGHLSVTGNDLFNIGIAQAEKVGVEIIRGEAVGAISEAGLFKVETASMAYECKALVIATGASRTTPKIKDLPAYEGQGVSYCAVCDGSFYRGKNVAVLGAGPYALHEVRNLLPLASGVTLLTNGEETSVDFPKSVHIRNEKISEVIGAIVEPPATKFGLKKLMPTRPRLTGVVFEDGSELPIEGLFIAVGIAGGTELARKIGATINSQGMVAVDENMKTSVPGLWAAGDCTGGQKQIVKAAYDGMLAGMDVVNYIRGRTKGT